jgi:non-ribosomal peptide synthetase component F
MDPAYPADRLAYILDDAQAAVLLTQERWAALLPSPKATVICVDTDAAGISTMPEDAPDSRARPEDLAYVIYTSGSTGRPKGTMINGRSFLNLTLWYQALCPVTPETRSLLMIPIGFDASLKNIVTPLVAGGAVVLSATESYDAPALLEFRIKALVDRRNVRKTAVSKHYPKKICRRF